MKGLNTVCMKGLLAGSLLLGAAFAYAQEAENIHVYKDGVLDYYGATTDVDRVAMDAEKTNLTIIGAGEAELYTAAVADVDSLVFGTEPTERTAWFVSPEGSGDKSGLNWQNALDLAGLRTLLTDDTDLAGLPIHLMEGTYNLDGNTLTPTKTIVLLDGGYSAQSLGRDLNRKGGETILSGNDKGTILTVDKQAVSIKNVVFSNGYSNVKDGFGTAIMVQNDWNVTKLELENCILRNNVGQQNEPAGALTMRGGKVYLNNVQFIDNKTDNRGAAIATHSPTDGTGENDLLLFMNNCSFRGNTVVWKDCWGSDINARKGHIFMNNCTFFCAEENEYGGNQSCINGDAYMSMANSTFIGNTNVNHVFRYGAKKDNHGFVNCLFIKNGARISVDAGTDNAISRGWNVHQGMSLTPAATDTDASSFTFTGLDTQENYYAWDVTGLNMTNFATKQGVVDAVKLCGDHAEEFVTWVGEDGFAKDQRGQARNANKMQPGAYDAGLTESAE